MRGAYLRKVIFIMGNSLVASIPEEFLRRISLPLQTWYLSKLFAHRKRFFSRGNPRTPKPAPDPQNLPTSRN
jgi:hypothetical protein